jgi:hypothetical protein
VASSDDSSEEEENDDDFGFTFVKQVPILSVAISVKFFGPGTDVMIFLNIFAEFFGKKIGVFDSKQS